MHWNGIGNRAFLFLHRRYSWYAARYRRGGHDAILASRLLPFRQRLYVFEQPGSNEGYICSRWVSKDVPINPWLYAFYIPYDGRDQRSLLLEEQLWPQPDSRCGSFYKRPQVLLVILYVIRLLKACWLMSGLKFLRGVKFYARGGYLGTFFNM